MDTGRTAMMFSPLPSTLFGLAILALLAVGLSNCGTPTVPDEMTFTSSNVNGHTHTVTLSKTDFQGSGNIVKTTSSSQGHIHVLEISGLSQGLFDIGITITPDTGPPDPYNGVDDHWHTFTIKKWW